MKLMNVVDKQTWSMKKTLSPENISAFLNLFNCFQATKLKKDRFLHGFKKNPELENEKNKKKWKALERERVVGGEEESSKWQRRETEWEPREVQKTCVSRNYPHDLKIFTPTLPLDAAETSKRKGCSWYFKE